MASIAESPLSVLSATPAARSRRSGIRVGPTPRAGSGKALVPRRLPSPTRMYRAVLDRDREFEGVFVLGVKTTGIFCRPTCGAKKPLLKNVEFFADAAGAMFAGYRACKRCAPLDVVKARPALVDSLMKLVEWSSPARVGDADLRELGIDPGTARRAFLKHCGMTFQAYQRARRMGEAFHTLRAGRSKMNVIQAANARAGYESESGFREAFAKVFGTTPRGAKGCLVSKWIDTPLGAMIAVAGDDGLCLLEFCDRRALERELVDLRKRFGDAIVPGENDYTKNIERELSTYFAGKSFEFKTKLVIAGTPFQEKVWRGLLEIPPGETRSYGQLAVCVGAPGASRAIGKANGDNRLAIVVPCHRVIRGDGSMCGYAGGVWRKEWLLGHERARVWRSMFGADKRV